MDPKRVAREWLWFAGTGAHGLLADWRTLDLQDELVGAVAQVYGAVLFVRLTVWAVRRCWTREADTRQATPAAPPVVSVAPRPPWRRTRRHAARGARGTAAGASRPTAGKPWTDSGCVAYPAREWVA